MVDDPLVDLGDDDDEVYELVVDPENAGGRIDAVIAAQVESLSRAVAQRLLDDGRVTLNGVAVAKAGTKVKQGDAIVVRVPPPEPLEVLPEDIPLVVLYEDADLIVIDKPPGLVVHPAPGHTNGTLVNALLFHCKDLSGIGGVLRPGIVHRLDKDTSGVMVATKSDRAHTVLGAAFKSKSTGQGSTIHRAYLAIASPPPPQKQGTLRTLYGRHPIHRKKFSSKVASGKSAVTHYSIVEMLHASAIVELRLETGRTHQIRVHASDHGWPLIGDPVYGRVSTDERVAAAATALGRQALHAHTLAFDHPVTGKHLSFTSQLPADMIATRDALRGA